MVIFFCGILFGMFFSIYCLWFNELGGYENKWHTAYFCSDCGKEVSFHEMMYSSGRCPYCGYAGTFTSTVMDVEERGYKLVRVEPFWKFWKRHFIREFEDDTN